MNLLDHSSLAGTLKYVSATSGGEWVGLCPWCGGKDRFHVWPDHPKSETGRFWCRDCGQQGDGIAFIRERDGLSYRKACEWFGLEPEAKRQGAPRHDAPAKPRLSSLPGGLWSAAAGRFADRCAAVLSGAAGPWADPGGEGRAYAEGRGLTAETCAALKIGWNPSDAYESREAWGLQSEMNPRTGKPRKVWLPAGLVFPTIIGGKVVALKIRRATWKDGDTFPKYVAVAGSGQLPLILAPGKGKPVVIVESEVDAILIYQEAKERVTAMAMRTAKGKPDSVAHSYLMAAPRILVATDNDEAGKLAWPWWREHYPAAKPHPVPKHYGKDVGDLARCKGMVKVWVASGLRGLGSPVEVVPEARPPREKPADTEKNSSGKQGEFISLSEDRPPEKHFGSHIVCEPLCVREEPQSDFLKKTESQKSNEASLEAQFPHLVCCPETGNWRYRTYCLKCPTPCEKRKAAYGICSGTLLA